MGEKGHSFIASMFFFVRNTLLGDPDRALKKPDPDPAPFKAAA